MFKARGIAVTEDESETIENYRDVDQLNAWIERAATATPANEILA